MRVLRSKLRDAQGERRGGPQKTGSLNYWVKNWVVAYASRPVEATLCLLVSIPSTPQPANVATEADEAKETINGEGSTQPNGTAAPDVEAMDLDYDLPTPLGVPPVSAKVPVDGSSGPGSASASYPDLASQAAPDTPPVKKTKTPPSAQALKAMNLERLQDLEMIDPRLRPPWRTEAFTEIEIEPDREIAAQRADTIRSTSDIVVYSDASGRQAHLGAAAVTLDNNLEVSDSSQIQVGSMDRWSVHAAELIGILHTINIINKVASERRRLTGEQVRLATILSDSMSALQAIQNPGNKSGQRIIHAILQAAINTKTHGVTIGLQWLPGHCEALGNDSADRLAKEAAIPGKTHTFCPLLSWEKAFIRENIHLQCEKEWKESREGGHLRTIYNALPAKYTRQLYGPLPRNQAYLLAQLRTGHCWLSVYAKAFQFQLYDPCVCGDRETLKHVLWDCPDLRNSRRILLGEVDDAFNSVSSLLGPSRR